MQNRRCALLAFPLITSAFFMTSPAGAEQASDDPLSSARCERVFAGLSARRLPWVPVEPIPVSEASKLPSYLCATYDQEDRLKTLTKYVQGKFFFEQAIIYKRNSIEVIVRGQEGDRKYVIDASATGTVPRSRSVSSTVPEDCHVQPQDFHFISLFESFFPIPREYFLANEPESYSHRLEFNRAYIGPGMRKRSTGDDREPLGFIKVGRLMDFWDENTRSIAAGPDHEIVDGRLKIEIYRSVPELDVTFVLIHDGKDYLSIVDEEKDLWKQMVATFNCVSIWREDWEEIAGRAIARGDYSRVLRLIRENVRPEDPEVQFGMGYVMLEWLADPEAVDTPTFGVEDALDYVWKAASAGVPQAAGLLRDAYEHGKYGIGADPELAKCWRTVEIGDSAAQACLTKRE